MSFAPLPASAPTSDPPRPPPPRIEWAYFFDIDGTLVDFADTPQSVRPDQELPALLEQLHQATGGAVALMSGRALADVDRLFPAVRFPAAGQHGAERRNATGQLVAPPPGTDLTVILQQVEAVTRDKPGLLVEFKGLSLALHYRQAPQLAEFVNRTMRDMLSEVGNDFCLQTGKSVIELKPCGKDKGRAVLEFMQEAPFAGRMPVFVGDDDTDEFGFETVNGLGGHSIKVGGGGTTARWRLPDVKAVQSWLRSI